ncbi:uncharacterized protein [Dermacentor albipictus]|uniref:uncharacterized protein isoform X1 n=1 Tax=Dermacentor albipictus TaxID=60249 RepID=UPI0038FC9C77
MSFLQVLLTAKTTYVLIDLVQKQRGEERPKVVRFDERVVRNGSSGLIIISIGVCLQPAQTCCSPSNSGGVPSELHAVYQKCWLCNKLLACIIAQACLSECLPSKMHLTFLVYIHHYANMCVVRSCQAV